MKTLFKITLIFAVVISVLSCKKQKNTITISGKVYKQEISYIYLHEIDKKFAPNKDTTLIKIPVINQQFYYEMSRPKESIILELNYPPNKGTLMYFPLFIEDEDIDINIEGEHQETAIGGKLNEEYKKYKENEKQFLKKDYENIEPLNNCVLVLKEELESNIEELKNLNSKFKEIKYKNKKDSIKNKMISLNKQTEEIYNVFNIIKKKRQKRQKEIYKKEENFKLEYVKNNQTFVSYYFLLRELRSCSYDIEYGNELNIDINKAKSYFESLKKEFPNHPYNKRIEYFITEIEKFKIKNNL